MPDFIYAPLAFLLRYLSDFFDNYGLALISLALILALFRVPFDIKSKRGSLGMALHQPKIKALQERFAGDTMRMNQEMQKLYKEHGIKPLGGCLWTIFPMIIILLMFQIIRQPLSHLMGLDQSQIDALRVALEGLGIYVGTGALYQVEMAGHIRPYFDQLHAVVPQIFNLNMNFLGLDLGQTPDYRVITGMFGFGEQVAATPAQWGLLLLPVISAVSAYISQKIMMATNFMAMSQTPQQQQMMKTMMLMMPGMSLFIGFTFPAAMSLYWTASSLTFALFGVVINKYFAKVLAGMKAEEAIKEKERQAEIDAKKKRTDELKAQGLTQENKGTSKKKKQVQEREKERQRLAENRAAELEENAEDKEENLSREGHRKFARGRAYDPDRFENEEDEAEQDMTLDSEEADGDLEETVALGADETADVELHADDDADFEDEADDDYEDDDFDEDEEK
ncbi:MAG: membrane protein insertase YidC [Oscillospiraceae bacterium]|nr:membrane protein insertase YidC [Oscillospiraceae bacterium]